MSFGNDAVDAVVVPDSSISRGDVAVKPKPSLSDDLLLVREAWLSVVPSLLIMILLWVVLYFFPVSFSVLVAIGVLGGLTYDVVKTLRRSFTRNPWRLLGSCGFVLGYFWLVYLLDYFLGGYGLLGVLVIVLILSLIIVARRWSLYMSWVRHIERRFFGMTAEERRERRKKQHGE